MRNEKLSTAVGQMYYDVDDKGDLYHLYEDIEKGAICNCPITIDYLELGLKGKLDKNLEEEFARVGSLLSFPEPLTELPEDWLTRK